MTEYSDDTYNEAREGLRFKDGSELSFAFKLISNSKEGKGIDIQNLFDIRVSQNTFQGFRATKEYLPIHICNEQDAISETALGFSVLCLDDPS